MILHIIFLRIIFQAAITTRSSGIKSATEKGLENELKLLRNELFDLRSAININYQQTKHLTAANQECFCKAEDIGHMRKLVLQQDQRHRLVVNKLNNLAVEHAWMKQNLSERQTPEVRQETGNDLDSQLQTHLKRSEEFVKKSKKRIKRLQKSTQKQLTAIKMAFQNDKMVRWNKSRDIAAINQILISSNYTSVRPEIYEDIQNLKKKDELVITKVTTLTKAIHKLREVCKAAVTRRYP